jgi:hypothetical protein
MATSNDHDPSDLREVDRLLRQLNPDGSSRLSHTRPSPGGRTAVPGGPRPAARSATPSLTPLTVWIRVLLGAVLAGALTQWPYLTCGPELGAYLGAAAIVIWMGVWGSMSAWSVRVGWAQVLGIGTLITGIALAAYQLLPRIGYAGLWVPWNCVG